MKKWLVFVGLFALAIPVAWNLLPRTSTDDAVLDSVLRRVDPFGDCVTVWGRTTIDLPSGDEHAPILLTADRFKNGTASKAAKAIARPFNAIAQKAEKSRHFGKRDPDRCAMSLDEPAYSGDFAFVAYSSPGGEIGVIAFQKGRFGGWSKAERVRLGFW